jgi:hypothetical protein
MAWACHDKEPAAFLQHDWAPPGDTAGLLLLGGMQSTNSCNLGKQVCITAVPGTWQGPAPDMGRIGVCCVDILERVR